MRRLVEEERGDEGGNAGEVNEDIAGGEAEGDDERMCVRDKAGGTANDVVTQALRLAADGRCGEAIEKLDSIADNSVLSAPLVARLRHRLDHALSHDGRLQNETVPSQTAF